MKRIIVKICLICVFLFIGNSTVIASGTEDDQAKPMVYGWELMTPEERVEHRNKMRNFATVEERDAYRREHHKRMAERAKERGVTLPEPPSGFANMD